MEGCTRLFAQYIASKEIEENDSSFEAKAFASIPSYLLKLYASLNSSVAVEERYSTINALYSQNSRLYIESCIQDKIISRGDNEDTADSVFTLFSSIPREERQYWNFFLSDKKLYALHFRPEFILALS